MTKRKQRAERVTGVSNVTYDLTTMFANKLEGLAALQTYKADADETSDQEARALMERLEQTARTDIEQLRELLARRLAGTT